jgi:hypothetical protein
LVEYQTVQASRPRLWRRFAALCLATCATSLVAAPAALAIVPPDISASTLECVDSDAGALRNGDDLACNLTASMASGTENANITATVTLPATVGFGSAAPPATYDSSTRVITFGQQALGLTFSPQTRSVVFHVTAGPGLAAGTAIAVPGDIVAVGDLDAVTDQKAVTSPDLLISPLVADLATSAVGCSDVNGATLLPGELVSCQLDVVNTLGHEDAASVAASLAVTGATWLLGGSNTGPGSTSFSATDIGAVAAGASKSVSATFAVPTTAFGGALVTATGFIAGLSSPSSSSIFLSKFATSLVVSAGPANLLLSTLLCRDSNNGVLVAGDDLTCTVTVMPAVGREDVQGSAATIEIPAHALYASGGDSHDATTVVLGPASLGDVLAGHFQDASFHLKVADGTPVGTTLQPLGTLTATSVPLGGPLTQPLTGQVLVVGREVVLPGESPTVPDTPASQPPAVKPPVAVATGYKLKAKTIRIKLRRVRGKRSFVYVKKHVVRTPRASGNFLKKVTVPRKGKWAPKRGKVKIKGTRLTYTLKKGKKAKDRFHYTVTDRFGKKATGTVIVSRKKK